MRTIICSDAHGYPSLITNALDAAGFAKGSDRFVYAGDLVDRGPDPVGCFELVDSLADEVLFGNHDVACALGLDVYPRDPRARVLASRLRDRALEVDGTWHLATECDGILVVHAGLGEHWRGEFTACASDVSAFASLLDECFRGEFTAAIETGDPEWGGSALDFDGPLWFRPFEDGLPLCGLRQVIGHTPTEFYDPHAAETLRTLGVHLIDPGAYRFENAADAHGHYRCAVIEDGLVTILTPDPSLSRSPKQP